MKTNIVLWGTDFLALYIYIAFRELKFEVHVIYASFLDLQYTTYFRTNSEPNESIKYQEYGLAVQSQKIT